MTASFELPGCVWQISKMRQLQNYLNGSWVASPFHREPLKHVATGEPLARIPASSHEDLVRAVDASRSGQQQALAQSAVERARTLRAMAQELEKRGRDFAQFESMTQGQPMELALRLSVPWAVAAFRRWATWVESGPVWTDTWRAPGELLEGRGAWLVQPELLRFPLVEMAQAVAQGIALGCPLILAPAAQLSVAAYQLGQIAQLVGLEPGLLQIVLGGIGTPRDLPPDITSMRDVQVTPSASVTLGWDEDTLQDVLRVALLNSGAHPECGTNVFVPEASLEEAAASLELAISSLEVGDPLDRRSYLGPTWNPDLTNAAWTSLVNHPAGRVVLAPTPTALREELARARSQLFFGMSREFLRPGLVVAYRPELPLLPANHLIVRIRPYTSLRQVSRELRQQELQALTVLGTDSFPADLMTVRAQSVWVGAWLRPQLELWNAGGDVLGLLSDTAAVHLHTRRRRFFGG